MDSKEEETAAPRSSLVFAPAPAYRASVAPMGSIEAGARSAKNRSPHRSGGFSATGRDHHVCSNRNDATPRIVTPFGNPAFVGRCTRSTSRPWRRYHFACLTWTFTSRQRPRSRESTTAPLPAASSYATTVSRIPCMMARCRHMKSSPVLDIWIVSSSSANSVSFANLFNQLRASALR